MSIKLICGVSRAGKTTYSQQFDNVIHLDEAARTGKRYEAVNNHVSKIITDITVEGIYDKASARIDLLNSYHGTGGKICIFIDPTEEEIKSRPWVKRHGGYYRKHEFEPPTYDEGWDEIWIRRNDEERLLEKGGD